MESAVGPSTGEASHEVVVERRQHAEERARGPQKGSRQQGRVGYSFKSPLRDARVARGLTLADVARKVGVSTTSVRRAEKPSLRRHLSKTTLDAIEQAIEGVKERARGPQKGSRQQGRVGYSFKSPLRDARVARGLTLADVARKVGVSTTSVRRAEKPSLRRHLSKTTLDAIEQAIEGVKVIAPTTAGQAIRTARLAARLTIDGLATLMGVSREHISRLEVGTYRPSAAVRARIFAELGLDLRRFYPSDVYPRAFGSAEPRIEVRCEIGEEDTRDATELTTIAADSTTRVS